MKELIQSIKNFLLDIQPQLEAVKNEVPAVMSVEDEIQKIGTLEMLDSVVEEVEVIAELNDSLAEAQLTPSEIGLAKVEESNEVKLQKQIDELLIELEATKLELNSIKVESEKTKLELSKTEQEYKNQFSLSAIKGNADEINPKEYLRQLLKNNKK